jgi:hypothetical protein
MALLVRKICNTNDVDRDLDDFNATATAPWLRIADAPLSTVVTKCDRLVRGGAVRLIGMGECVSPICGGHMHRRRGLYAGRCSPCSRSRVAEVLLSNIIMAGKAGDVSAV